MTTTEHPQEVATAAASGASATERFHADKSPFEAVKDTPPEALAEAIRKVHAGLRVIDPELAQESVLLGPNPLTEREKEVLLAAATGADAREIATRLSLGEGTVRNYLSSAIAKTHARNRTEAARTAETNGWL